MIKELYSKINNAFVINPRRSRKSISDQKKFLGNFSTPSDDYEYSYDKYRCQMFYHYPLLLQIAYHIGAIFVIPVLYYRYKKNAKKNINNTDTAEIIVRRNEKMEIEDVLPEDFLKGKGSITEIPFPSVSEGVLDSDGIKIIKKAFAKYWRHPYYLLVVIIKIGEFGYLLRRYRPKCILSYVFERDFANSLESMYCEQNGVDHVCFMHGDSMFSVDRAFSRPTYYCVWGEHYEKMFHELRCSAKEFIIYTPKKWVIDGVVRAEGNYPYFATYYFSAETPQIIQGVKRIFDYLTGKGYQCKVRVHPRFSDIEYIKRIFKGYAVEDSKITLQKSLLDTHYVIALNSTVLSQAYFSGKDIIIDDVTDKQKYDSLYEREYIMVRYPIMRLSELLNDVESKKGRL